MNGRIEKVTTERETPRQRTGVISATPASATSSQIPAPTPPKVMPTRAEPRLWVVATIILETTRHTLPKMAIHRRPAHYQPFCVDEVLLDLLFGGD